MNKIIIFLLVFVCILLLFIVFKKEPVKQENQQILPKENLSKDQFTKIPDIITVVDCHHCEGSGIFEFKSDDPMVTLGLAPEGMTETCQSCKGLGKMKKCERPNGMIYYMSLR